MNTVYIRRLLKLATYMDKLPPPLYKHSSSRGLFEHATMIKEFGLSIQCKVQKNFYHHYYVSIHGPDVYYGERWKTDPALAAKQVFDLSEEEYEFLSFADQTLKSPKRFKKIRALTPWSNPKEVADHIREFITIKYGLKSNKELIAQNKCPQSTHPLR